MEHPAADFGVLALIVLAHEQKSMSPGVRFASGDGNALEQPHRPKIDILLKAAADRHQQPPKRDLIRHAGIADGAQKYRIVIASWSSPSSGIIRPVFA